MRSFLMLLSVLASLLGLSSTAFAQADSTYYTASVPPLPTGVWDSTAAGNYIQTAANTATSSVNTSNAAVSIANSAYNTASASASAAGAVPVQIGSQYGICSSVYQAYYNGYPTPTGSCPGATPYFYLFYNDTGQTFGSNGASNINGNTVSNADAAYLLQTN